MYRVVQDLTHDELDELKLSYLSVLENDTEYPAWLPDPEDISDEVLFGYYDGVLFTDDDFWCNLEKEG